MAYSYWKLGRQNEMATFDIFFRKNPFEGEFTVFAGLENALQLLEHFKFSPEHIEYLKGQMPTCEPEFFDYLASVDASCLTVYSMREGCMVFPHEPVIRVEGPIAVCQLLETPLLCMVNYASLIATNSARHRIAVGDKIGLSEFGLRRAQGPDGGMTASKYSYMGGFNSTSNVQAGLLYHIPISGTHAHSYVLSFDDVSDIKNPVLNGVNLVEEALKVRRENNWPEARDSELAAFIAYALSFPKACLCLIDTFDVLKSGLPNFICTAVALYKAGYKALGIRIDSGDLAYLSRMIHKEYEAMEATYNVPFASMIVVASNDINVDVLYSLNKQNHRIDSFGIGTNLVTCQGQPALGMVFKLADANGKPRMKLSEDPGKTTTPGKKKVYRLYSKEGYPILDLVMLVEEEAPKVGERILCHHVHNTKKRCYCTPSRVEELLVKVWEKENGCVYQLPPLKESRDYVLKQLKEAREDHVRYMNPTPYKVSTSTRLSDYVNDIWTSICPIAELE